MGIKDHRGTPKQFKVMFYVPEILNLDFFYFDLWDWWVAVFVVITSFLFCFYQENDEKKRIGPGPLPVPGSLHHVNKLSFVPRDLNALFLKEQRKLKKIRENSTREGEGG